MTQSNGGYEVAGPPPTPGLHAALASWCADTGRLITWSRTTGGSLEDIYLDLVARGRAGGGADAHP